MNQSIIRQKEKPLKVFYSKTINQSFMVPLVDEDGNKIKKLHAVTGMPMIINKLQQYEEEMFTFAPISQSVNKGTLSGFFVYEDTEKRVIDKLEDLAADEKISWLMTAEEYEKEHEDINPEDK